MELPKPNGKRRRARPTTLERDLKNILFDLKLNFETEYGVTYSVYERYYDFAVYDGHLRPILFIETHGEHYHAKPNTGIPLNKYQKKSVINDKLKTYMAELMGIPLLTLWESEVKLNKEECKKKVLNALAIQDQNMGANEY